jgi:hypothetical protein
MMPCSEWIDLSFSTTRGWVVKKSLLLGGGGGVGDALALVAGESVLIVARDVVGSVQWIAGDV